MTGERGFDQPAQAVVQAQGLGLAVDGQLALLQGVDQFDALRLRLRGPGFQKLGLLGRVGGDEVFGVAGMGRQWQQQCQGEDEAVEGGGHIVGLAQNFFCGSGLAREGGGSGRTTLTDTQPSRASPLPQGSCVGPERHAQARHPWAQLLFTA
jgi:hypothetical protein